MPDVLRSFMQRPGRIAPTLLKVAMLVLTCMTIAPAAALAATAPSPTIAGAQPLNIGDTETGGGSNIDYWTVKLNGGDQFEISVNPGCQTSCTDDSEFELYAPGTTDATFTAAPPLQVAPPPFASATDVVTLQAPYSGTFVLAVCEPKDYLDDGGDCRKVDTNPTQDVNPMTSYTFTTALIGGGVSQSCANTETRAGSTIASASTLAVGSCESGGGNNIDYWTVQLHGGDQLQLSVNPEVCQNECDDDYAFGLFAPGTTDTSFTQAPAVTTASISPPYGSAPDVITLQAPYSGTFVLAVCEPAASNGTNGDCRPVDTGGARDFIEPMTPYTFTTALVGGGVSQSCAASETRAGSTIASASTLAVGSCESGGGNDIDFWNIQLAGGDQLQLTADPPSAAPVEFDLYAPGTTDTSFTRAAPLATATTSSITGSVAQVLSLKAPSSGTFVLAVCEPSDGEGGDCRGIDTGEGRGYTEPMDPYTFTTALTRGPSPSPRSKSSMTIANQRASVSANGSLDVRVRCSGAPCSGRLTLTATSERSTGRRSHRRTRKVSEAVGNASFSRLGVGAARISVKLNRTGLRLLKRHGGKLSATAQMSYKAGSARKKVHAAISLRSASAAIARAASRAEASSVVAYADCQPPNALPGVTAKAVRNITGAGACRVAMSVDRWWEKGDDVHKLYRCQSTGHPVLRTHKFDSWRLAITTTATQVRLLTMSRGAASSFVVGQDFPIDCI